MRTISSILVTSTFTLLGCAGGGAPDDVGSSAEALGTVVHHSVQDGTSAYANIYDGSGYLYLSVWEGGSRSARAVSLNFQRSAVDPASWACETYTIPGWCDPGPVRRDAGTERGDGGDVPPSEYDAGDVPPGEYDGGDVPPPEYDDAGVCTAVPTTYTYCYYTRYIYDYAYGSISPRSFGATRTAARLRVSLGSEPGLSFQHCVYDSLAGTYECSTTPAGSSIDLRWTSNHAYTSESNGVQSTRYGPYSYRTNGKSTSMSAAVSGTVLGTAIPVAGAYWSDASLSDGHTVTHDMYRER